MKANILRELNTRNTCDFLPLLSLNQDKLIEAVNAEKKDEKKYRVYILNDKLKIEPHLVAAAFAKFPRIFSMSKDYLPSKVDILLKAGIQPDNILSSLSCLSLSEDMLTLKISQLRDGGISDIKAWMFLCENDRFEK